jgi:hypothetical protein
MRNRSDILPIGRVNVKTGNFKWGNFYGFWGDDTTYEVYRINNGGIRVVATAGTEPIVPVGEHSSFKHYETGRFLFNAKCVEAVIGDEGFKSLGEKYGNFLSVATYK